MAKTSFFRNAMFGYHKADVNEFIARQNERNLALKSEMGELEKRFEQYRRYYESLLKLHEENLSLLRQVRMRASKNEEKVQALQSIFESVCAAYHELRDFANKQQQAVLSAGVYEEKALKYEELAKTMRELVLPGEAETGDRLPVLEMPGTLPEADRLDELIRAAEDAFGVLNADARAFINAAERLKIPGDPDAKNDDAAAL